jgi:hypothetical protein
MKLSRRGRQVAVRLASTVFFRTVAEVVTKPNYPHDLLRCECCGRVNADVLACTMWRLRTPQTKLRDDVLDLCEQCRGVMGVAPAQCPAHNEQSGG